MNSRTDDVIPTTDWVSFTDLGLAAAIGRPINIQNVGRLGNADHPIRIWTGPAKPAATFIGGRRLVRDAVAEIAAGEAQVYLRAEVSSTHVNIDYTP